MFTCRDPEVLLESAAANELKNLKKSAYFNSKFIQMKTF